MMLTGCNVINKKLNLENDHPIEQWSEKLIEENIGFSIDLSI
jgi:hypothetical protein